MLIRAFARINKVCHRIYKELKPADIAGQRLQFIKICLASYYSDYSQLFQKATTTLNNLYLIYAEYETAIEWDTINMLWWWILSGWCAPPCGAASAPFVPVPKRCASSSHKFLSQVPLTCSGRLLEPRGARPAVEGATRPATLLAACPTGPSFLASGSTTDIWKQPSTS